MKTSQLKTEDLSKYLYTIPQTASLLSCSPATIYKWLEQGKLSCVYPTSKARITRNSIAQFVRQLESEVRISEVGGQ